MLASDVEFARMITQVKRKHFQVPVSENVSFFLSLIDLLAPKTLETLETRETLETPQRSTTFRLDPESWRATCWRDRHPTSPPCGIVHHPGKLIT